MFVDGNQRKQESSPFDDQKYENIKIELTIFDKFSSFFMLLDAIVTLRRRIDMNKCCKEFIFIHSNSRYLCITRTRNCAINRRILTGLSREQHDRLVPKWRCTVYLELEIKAFIDNGFLLEPFRDIVCMYR